MNMENFQKLLTASSLYSMRPLQLFTANVPYPATRELKQLRRWEWRQRERHLTKGFDKQDNALHMGFTLWYISLPFSAKQQRKMTKFKVLGER